jgi:alginate O-acetyltransferase complex protein AlgI
MLFSSLVFLFLFLPITLAGYYIIDKKFRNHWLLFTSLIFFAWGGVSFTSILLFSILFNYFYGLKIEKHLDTKAGYWWLFAGVTTNLLFLGVFKYANFIIQNLNSLISVFSIPQIPDTKIVLPIGISFYTFHSLSYLVDIYRRKTTAQHNIFDLSLYICMFSQLIAGPIIRYSDVWMQLRNRTHNMSKFSYGVERFLIGLAKKVLLANTFARVADDLFSVAPGSLCALSAWLGILSYTLQIYCDFAGYSDMAIGLGRMFGFEFLENFNFPYIAKSVKEFWRRWHISLSSFFRDYVYIPLGGNRVKVNRVYLNLFIVFFLTGFWHGASWNFVVWGLFHGFFMVIERLGFDKILEKMGKPLSLIYTLLVVVFAWVLFRAETLSGALSYWGAMFRFSATSEQIALFYQFINRELVLAFIVAILGASGVFTKIGLYIQNFIQQKSTASSIVAYSYHTFSALFLMGLFFLCSMYLISGTYNPFIYYRF